MPKRDSHTSTPRRPSSSGHRSKRRSPTEQQGNESAAAGGAAPTSNASTARPNFDSSDPYAVLGVSPDATPQQIKLSYRKLALKHHPDRQSSESDKKAAHENFAAIGHAYEILGDEGRRREYDDGLRQQQQGEQWGGQSRSSRGSRGFGHDPFSMFNDPFFSFSFGGPRSGGTRSSSPRSDFHFTDPFELFEQFFAEEMGRHRRHHSRSTDQFSSDPFFSSGDPFSDPFFSSGGMGGGGRSMFGRGGLGQMMSGHFDRMDSMMSQMHSGSMLGGFDEQHQQSMRSNGNTRGSSHNFISTSSSYGGGRQSVSTSTRTTIVNGVRTTVRERTITHPDGRVDRHVETIEGDGNEMGRLPSENRAALEHDGGRRRSRR